MGAFAWTKLVLVDFLVPIAWPAVALASILILRAQIRSVVQQLADSVGHLMLRMKKGEIGPVKAEFIDTMSPPSEVKQVPLQEDK